MSFDATNSAVATESLNNLRTNKHSRKKKKKTRKLYNRSLYHKQIIAYNVLSTFTKEDNGKQGVHFMEG